MKIRCPDCKTPGVIVSAKMTYDGGGCIDEMEHEPGSAMCTNPNCSNTTRNFEDFQEKEGE